MCWEKELNLQISLQHKPQILNYDAFKLNKKLQGLQR